MTSRPRTPAAKSVASKSTRTATAMLPCRAYALGLKSNILSYNVWYQELGAASEERQKRWREFLMDADEREREVQAGDWVEGNESQRRRTQQMGRDRLGGVVVAANRRRARRGIFPNSMSRFEIRKL